MLRRVVLVGVAVLLVAAGALLWVDAGTRHSESLPSSGALLRAGGSPAPGPNRLPAQLVWTAAVGVSIVALLSRQRDRADG